MGKERGDLPVLLTHFGFTPLTSEKERENERRLAKQSNISRRSSFGKELRARKGEREKS